MRNEGFAVINPENNAVQIFNSSNLPGLVSNEITPIHIDKAQNLWFETNSIGISRFNLKTYQYKKYSVPTVDILNFVSPPLSFVIEDVNGRLWIQPKRRWFFVIQSYYRPIGSVF
ncbi:MAG: hypothetical protein QM751_04920 [Paludibacteraceae bacterium]